jgi:hypothetical protein
VDIIICVDTISAMELYHIKWKNFIINGIAAYLRLYKTLIRPVIAYGSQAWVTNKCDENKLNIFERKILRKIFGAVREGDHWRARYNNELYGLYTEQDLVSYIKVG